MRVRMIAILLALLLALMPMAAAGETVRGDLEGRFGGGEITHGGVEYRMLPRLTAVLAMGVGADEEGRRVSDVAFLLAVDDDAKTFRLVEIRPDTAVDCVIDGEAAKLRFRDAWRLWDDPDEACRGLVDIVNAMLGGEVIEDYLVFDVEGVKVIDEALAQGSTKDRLKALKARVDEMSSDALSDVYASLSDYIFTGMKSGAVMKIADKAERYEIPPRHHLPGEEALAEDGGTVFLPDAEGITELKLAVFYEENPWSDL